MYIYIYIIIVTDDDGVVLISGATLGKCINRAIGTFLAGSLGVGVHCIANYSGQNLKPIVLGTSVFLLGK